MKDFVATAINYFVDMKQLSYFLVRRIADIEYLFVFKRQDVARGRGCLCHADAANDEGVLGVLVDAKGFVGGEF